MNEGDKYPCRVCGYNGPNWYQPEVHTCPGNPNFTPPSAGLSEATPLRPQFKTDGMYALVPADPDIGDDTAVVMKWSAYRALAQRLREAEDRLSTTIRVSQEYASETAQVQERLREVEQERDKYQCDAHHMNELRQRIAQLKAQVAELEGEA
jgi:hypothetical protein